MYSIRPMLFHRLALIAAACLVTFFCARFGLNQNESGAYRGTERSEILDALDFWSRSRAYPAHEIPAAGFASAHARMNALLRKQGVDTSPWVSIGPDNVAGRTLDLCVNPVNPKTIWAASASGGLWRSWSGGEGRDAWHAVPTGFPVTGISTIAMAPDDTNTMYIGTGEVYGYQRAWGGLVDRLTRGSYGVGILKTTDGGTTWIASLDWSYNTQRGVRDMEVDPRDARIVWAATSEGTYRSSDAGASWVRVHDVPMAMSLLLDPERSGTAIVACGNFGQDGSGIYVTTDAGAVWTRSSTGLPGAWIGKISLARAPSDPSVIYASIGSVSAPFIGTALCRSGDRGASWTVVAQDNYSDYQGWYSHDVLVHATRPDRVITAGIDVWRKESESAAMEQRSDWRAEYFGTIEPGDAQGDPYYVHADIHCIVQHPSSPETVYFGTDGGVFRSTDFGASFRSLNGGLRTTQFYNGFACAASAAFPAVGGLQDNGTVVYEGRDSWKRVLGGDGAYCAVNPGNPARMFASTQYGSHYRTSDGGDSWDNVLSSDIRAAFVSPLLLCAVNPDVLYAARQKVLKSVDGGDSWTETNKGAVLDGNPVLVLAGATRSVDTVYAATAPLRSRAKVFVTRNGGASWTNVTGTLPDRYPVDIAVHPADSRTACIVFSGFGISHVWKTTDGGSVWTDIGASLPDLPFTSACFDPMYPEHLYAGCDLGVFLSQNGGETWRAWSDGLPTAVQAMDLALVPSERKIRVATHGNGVFERPLADAPVVSVRRADDTPAPAIQSLAPMPAHDRLEIRIAHIGATGAVLTVRRVDGRVHTRLRLDAASQSVTTTTLPLSGLSDGVYFLTLEDAGVRETKKFIITSR